MCIEQVLTCLPKIHWHRSTEQSKTAEDTEASTGYADDVRLSTDDAIANITELVQLVSFSFRRIPDGGAAVSRLSAFSPKPPRTIPTSRYSATHLAGRMGSIRW